MIIDAGSYRVGVDVDVHEATFEGIGRASGDIPVAGRAVGTARRAVVEVQRRVGGLPQLALLAGNFQVHFYMNRTTSAVNYDVDYKIVFVGGS